MFRAYADNFWKVLALVLLVSQIGKSVNLSSATQLNNQCSKFYSQGSLRTTKNGYVGRVLNQCESGTCWLHAGVSLLEEKIFGLTGRQFPISLEFLYYHLLRDRFSYAAQAIHYNQNERDKLLYDGNNFHAFVSLVKAHGLVGENQWKPQRSLIENASSVKDELAKIWQEADITERNLYSFYSIENDITKWSDAKHAEFARFRNGVLLKIESVLKKYTGDLPSIDPESVEMKISRGLTRDPFQRIYVRENINPQFVEGWDKGNYKTLLHRYNYLPEHNYLRVPRGKGSNRDDTTYSKVDVVEKSQLVKKIKSGLATGMRYYCVVNNWRAFIDEVGGPLSFTQDTWAHAIVIGRSESNEQTVRIQNSWGTTFGENGFLDVPIDILLKYATEFSYPMLDSSQNSE